jgi:hypothetical protein
MKWYSNINHKYNNNIPYKKIALQKYCNSKNYKMIWLDFEYDEKFKKIYKNVLYNNI